MLTSESFSFTQLRRGI